MHRPSRAVRTALRSLVLGAVLWAGAGARAQEGAAEDRAQAFKPVEGAVKEDISGVPLMVAAYGTLWLFLLGYGFRLIRLQQRAESDVQRLERALARERPADESAG